MTTANRFGSNIDAPIVKTPLPDWPYQELLYETIDDGRIALITMNRPERMNSSDPDMGFRWYDAWTRFANDDDQWVAIVTGAGDRAFSSGQDLKSVPNSRRRVATRRTSVAPPTSRPSAKSSAVGSRPSPPSTASQSRADGRPRRTAPSASRTSTPR